MNFRLLLVSFAVAGLFLISCGDDKESDLKGSYDLPDSCNNSCVEVSSSAELEKELESGTSSCICVKAGTYEGSFTVSRAVAVIGEKDAESIITKKDGTTLTVSSDSVTLQGLIVKVEGPSNNAILADGIKDLKIDDCNVEATDGTGLNIQNSEGIIVQNGIIIQNGIVIQNGIIVQNGQGTGMNVANSKDVTISGGSFTTDGGVAAAQFNNTDGIIVQNGIVIQNGIIVQNGILREGVDENPPMSFGFLVKNCNNVTVDEATFKNKGINENNSDSYSLVVADSESVAINNSSFNGDEKPNTTAIYASGTELEIKDSNIEKFTTDGLIAINESAVSISGGKISSINSVRGAVYVNKANITLNSGLEISDSVSSDAMGGRGIVLVEDSEINAENITVKNCKSSGILFDKSFGNIKTATVTSNKYTGLWIQNSNGDTTKNITVEDSDIDENTATGIFMIDSSKITVKGTKISASLVKEWNEQQIGDGLVFLGDALQDIEGALVLDSIEFIDNGRAGAIFDAQGNSETEISGLSLTNVSATGTVTDKKYGIIIQNGKKPEALGIENNAFQKNDDAFTGALEIFDSTQNIAK